MALTIACHQLMSFSKKYTNTKMDKLFLTIVERGLWYSTPSIKEILLLSSRLMTIIQPLKCSYKIISDDQIYQNVLKFLLQYSLFF